VLAIGDALIERAMLETGLPRARLESERGRTAGQLRLFASVVRQGDWQGVVIDTAQPEREPLPRADLRVRNIALGPVAVFGASNFPLAFSVAGGDTVSALAAGCPVIVKGHPGHPGTGELVARAIVRAVAACDLPVGVFAYLPGSTHALGEALVADPRIAAVGFTGSRAGGLALTRIAGARPVPIPVYAEMSSVNPVVVLPGALAARGQAVAQAFVGSMTQGSGQFCTSPGLILAIAGAEFDPFEEAVAEAIGVTPAGQMLGPSLRTNFVTGLDAIAAHDATTVVAEGQAADGPNMAVARVHRVEGTAVIADPALSYEVFGPSALLIRCSDLKEVRAVLASLEGQLTVTLHLDDEDHAAARQLLPLLERLAGRILVNGWPTGVEVTHAMVHGGPFPATSDSRTTSVGAKAIERFLRPVCYQNVPPDLLPTPLADDNPLGLARRIDGVLALAAAKIDQAGAFA
jgi:2,5-dioxopentanoate dehydrogenase